MRKLAFKLSERKSLEKNDMKFDYSFFKLIIRYSRLYVAYVAFVADPVVIRLPNYFQQYKKIYGVFSQLESFFVLTPEKAINQVAVCCEGVDHAGY